MSHPHTGVNAPPRHFPSAVYRKAARRASARRTAEKKRRKTLGPKELAIAKALPPAAYPPGGLAGVIATPIRQQPPNDVNCIAYAVAGAMECFWSRRRGSSNGVPFLSVEDIYERAGLDIDRAMAVARLGVVDELCRPFPGPRCANPAPNTWAGTFDAMQDPLDEMADAMCSHLATVGPLVITIPMFANWDGFTGPGLYTAVGGAAGGHALVVVGYEQVGGVNAWIVKNSYGTGWGDHGFGRIAWGDKNVKPENIVFATTAVTHP